MALTILNTGRDNEILIDPGVIAVGNGTIALNGDRSSVRIESGCFLHSAHIDLGDDCTFVANENCRLAAMEVVAAKSAHVTIGPRSNFNWHTRLYLLEPATITIGSGCLFGSETMLSVSDMHSIIDRDTGRRINPPADIMVQDKVWVAHAVTILKGASIGTGSIIGIGSVVTGTIEPYAVATGNPARTSRTNVTWDSDLLPN